MFTLLIRCIIIYLIVLVIFRIMGKRQLGELQPFEFVITLIIADLATIPMTEINIPIIHGIIPLITLMLLHFFISWISRKSIFMRKVINGKPVLLITPQGINYEALKELNMNFNDLNEALRNLNYFSLDQIEYAIVETNGKMTVLPNSQNAPLTSTDFNIKKEPSALPVMIINDGKLMKENLQVLKIDENFVMNNMKKVGAFKYKDVIIATLDNLGKLYIQIKDKPYVVLQTNHKVEAYK